VPYSHEWPFYTSEYIAQDDPELRSRRELAREGKLSSEEKGPLIGELGQAWTRDFKSLEAKYNTERVKMELKAGDVVVWHSLLAHGGSPRINPAISRKSVVFHYIGMNTKLYSFEQFMLYGSDEIASLEPVGKALKKYKNLSYMRFDQFSTYVDGKEVHHTVK
jgi:ectoine hydroxylase-related dioxygenase (phytanoyl-CoA dioxygenase family)